MAKKQTRKVSRTKSRPSKRTKTRPSKRTKSRPSSKRRSKRRSLKKVMKGGASYFKIKNTFECIFAATEGRIAQTSNHNLLIKTKKGEEYCMLYGKYLETYIGGPGTSNDDFSPNRYENVYNVTNADGTVTKVKYGDYTPYEIDANAEETIKKIDSAYVWVKKKEGRQCNTPKIETNDDFRANAEDIKLIPYKLLKPIG